MVNDPNVEREDVGGDKPMGDPAETGTRVGQGGDLGVGPEGGHMGVEEPPDESTSEGPTDLSGLERPGRQAEEEGPVGPIEQTLPARP